MAWRRCITPGCKRGKLIQPFSSNTIHPWLCPTHRRQKQEKHLEQLAKLSKAKRFAKIMTESSD